MTHGMGCRFLPAFRRCISRHLELENAKEQALGRHPCTGVMAHATDVRAQNCRPKTKLDRMMHASEFRPHRKPSALGVVVDQHVVTLAIFLPPIFRQFFTLASTILVSVLACFAVVHFRSFLRFGSDLTLRSTSLPSVAGPRAIRPREAGHLHVRHL